MHEVWFPSKDSGSNVVGRVSEARTVDAKESEAQGTTVWKFVPVMLSMIPGKSHDVSSQAIKPHNKAALCERFPGAWEAYEEEKAQASTRSMLPKSVAMAGTPLDQQDFLPRDKIAWLITLGFSTIEQLADMDDQTVDGIRGAKIWRKKAQEFLKRT